MNNNKPNINLSNSKAWAMFFTIGILLIGFTAAWIINSYHQVTFKYDTERGSVTLIKPNSNDNPIEVKSGQPLTLREGDYILKRQGKNIIESEQTVKVTKDETFDINLYYSDRYLDQLYDFEKADIEATLYQQYPKILELYNLRNGRLYLDGNIYGASLFHIDDNNQNRDTLRVMMKKEGDEWKILTEPPTPVISQPLFPDIPLDVITQINRGR